MRNHNPEPRRMMAKLVRLVQRWIGFGFDLTGLTISDGEILYDLATGRD